MAHVCCAILNVCHAKNSEAQCQSSISLQNKINQPTYLRNAIVNYHQFIVFIKSFNEVNIFDREKKRKNRPSKILFKRKI